MGFSLGRRKSSQQQQSAPLTPEELGGYFGKIDELTGGRLDRYAREGTTPIAYESPEQRARYEAVQYEGATPEQLRALGGAGATRELKANTARRQALEEIDADPAFSVAQKFRARQLTDQDYTDRLDAIAKETEASLAGTAIDESGRRYQAAAEQAQRGFEAGTAADRFNQEEARRRYEAELRNAGLKAEDVERIAGIFFGGKGTRSSGGSMSRGFDSGFSIK